jgi:polyisoprenoid-binding protein YceI
MTPPTGDWVIDAARSQLAFQVRHLAISSVKGRFTRFAGTLHASETELRVEGSVEVASVDTGDEYRDHFLRSAEFFDCERHPRLLFSCACQSHLHDGRLTVEGVLTIRTVSLPLTLLTSFRGPDRDGRLGVRARGELNRSDYDLRFPSAGGYGDVLVGEKVKILIDAAALRPG